MTYSADSASMQLSKVLNFIIGTKDNIKVNRMRATKSKYSSLWHTQYRIGSSCDGLVLKGCDLDVMYIHNNIPVVDSLCCDVTHVTLPSNCLITCCSPSTAYMYLKIHKKLNCILNRRQSVMIDSLCNSVIHYNGNLLVYSTLFLEHHSDAMGGHSVGPSLVNMLSCNTDNDNVLAFHCKAFPRQAIEWIHRKRKYSWPSPCIIHLVKEVGYHLVPIGDYNTKMHQFQWRISFVLQECLLVRTFSHVQMQVFAFMKMIKSEVLSGYRSQQTGEALITSYHIKTLMFWTIECVPRYIWCEKNLLLCIQICLGTLKCFVKSNFMPHYFMPQCNLFKKHVLADRQYIINDLSKYAKNPLTVIDMMNPLMDIVRSGILRENNYVLQVLQKCEDLQIYTTIGTGHCSYNPMTVVHTLFTTVDKMNDYDWFLTYELLLSSMLNFNQRTENQPSDGVRSLYKHYRKVKNISLLYTHLNMSTGWLFLSSYLYQTHNYENCLKIINTKVILPITELPQVVYCGKIRDEKQLCYALTGECSSMSLSQLYKHLACCGFWLHVSLVPCELTFETNLFLEKGLNSIQFTPLPYAYFLSFLCAYHLHDARLQFTFLHHLQSMLTDKHFGCPQSVDSSCTLNMVGLCFELMGDVSNAAYYYRLSDNHIPPFFNEAANIRLQLLMIQNNIYH